MYVNALSAVGNSGINTARVRNCLGFWLVFFELKRAKPRLVVAKHVNRNFDEAHNDSGADPRQPIAPMLLRIG